MIHAPMQLARSVPYLELCFVIGLAAYNCYIQAGYTILLDELLLVDLFRMS